MARGAVVVIVSDGWERGDPALLGREMERLRGSPTGSSGSTRARPRRASRRATGGMAAALPHVDEFVSGHSLAALDEVVEAIGRASIEEAAMEFENTFVVDAPIDEVWDALLDVERVAPCMPGAQVLEQTGDDAYKVAIKVKVGPMSMTYKGDVEIVERDAEAHRGVDARARPRRRAGRGPPTPNVTMALRAARTAAPRRRSSPRCS